MHSNFYRPHSFVSFVSHLLIFIYCTFKKKTSTQPTELNLEVFKSWHLHCFRSGRGLAALISATAKRNRRRRNNECVWALTWREWEPPRPGRRWGCHSHKYKLSAAGTMWALHWPSHGQRSAKHKWHTSKTLQFESIILLNLVHTDSELNCIPNTSHSFTSVYNVSQFSTIFLNTYTHIKHILFCLCLMILLLVLKIIHQKNFIITPSVNIIDQK